MKALMLGLSLCLLAWTVQAQQWQLTSPDKQLVVDMTLGAQGRLSYQLRYHQQAIVEPSSLGLQLADGSDLSQGLTLLDAGKVTTVNEQYAMLGGKQSLIDYQALQQRFTFKGKSGPKLVVTFRASNHGLAYQYRLQGRGEHTVRREISHFRLPADSKAWLQPLAVAQTGYKNTNPSYEEYYQQDIKVGKSAPSPAGWALPALFKVKGQWLLISEAGMDGHYPGSRLAANSAEGDYHLAPPMKAEVFTGGKRLANGTLPLTSPWRFIAVGSLADITASTLGTSLAAPQQLSDVSYIKPGLAAWSWITGKDDSITFSIQKHYIDYAAKMHWPYVLIDVNWDKNIGWDGLAKLAQYGKAKGVGLWVWYNSSGKWNNTLYSPKGKLLTHQSRQQQFSHLAKLGIKGIKVDFFGGDGQSFIRYYLDILQDATQYRLMVNFHGATIPRGWQRTYPNLMTAEAVRGEEMVTFFQEAADLQANHIAMLPFTRNVFDPADFTPTHLGPLPGLKRRTTQGFELAAPVVLVSGVQHIATSPEVMASMPDFVRHYLSQLPSHWDQSQLLAGYPGKLAVFARRLGQRWYVAAINGENTAKTLTLDLGFVNGQQGQLITDGKAPLSLIQQPVTASKQTVVSLKGDGGLVMIFNPKQQH
ncbi:glycoside hydrolase family 97 protein [Gallaecimonas mangrovi]|uniref:glycoside hydrolase family 97 protein n=1 Tax=Gallaecimonas mangrovi TaxID=2291597 RepID=UPI000E1FD2BE|nr:glycoside hydrolase family 97 protein [Gallaecimonas mangrovi]